ncbi:hypothetical protein WA026_019022 [Henosepilachna vigintioctopunctata]|uniref:Resistance to inhibitors of cholinesterase protein 3 N-terminal domain-containing protein n=1 Tax=Henosepilachna vigintioctopunctata TaxID=420089 RepID=A0AAW1VA23_9CUCU
MMSERFQHPSGVRHRYTSTARMEDDFSPKKTMVILVIVVGCFAVLWPSVFYPMLVGSANQHIHPSAIDRTKVDIRQERAAQLRSEITHPAMLEKGSAIPQKHPTPREPKIIIDGEPPIPGMRPPMGAGAHGIRNPEPRTMGLVMPIYTVAIIIFFTYTIMKIIFRKHPDTDNIIYSTDGGQDRYRNSSKDSGSSCTLGDVELDQLRRRLRETEMAMERVVTQMAKLPLKSQDDPSTTSNMSNGSIKKDEKPSVKVMAMETSESCEGGKKWQSVNSSVLPNVSSFVNDQISPPQEIFLDRTLPPQSQILVADSATKTEKNSGDDPAVVLAGKMTLSVISLENENLEIQETENLKQNETNDKEILETSKQMLQTEIDCLIEEAVENLGISELDVIDAKYIKGEGADTGNAADTIEINEQITEMVDNISKLLGEKDHNTVQPEKSVEDETLKDERIAEIAAEETSQTIEKQGKFLNLEQSNDISPIGAINIINKTDIDNQISANLLIDDCRKDENSNENVASSSEELSHKSSNEHATSKLPDIKQPDASKASPNEITEPRIVSNLLSSSNRQPNEPEEKVTKDSQNIYDESAIEARRPVKIIFDKSAGEESNISHASLLNAKSSSEESGSTAHTASNPGSVINVSTKYDENTEEELDDSEDEESDVESEEEIEISEEEDIEENEINRDSSEMNERFNTVENALLINGNDQNDEKEESDEDEEVEEIIEEYSEEEEEEEVEDDEDINDVTHLSSNGNRHE